jgi:asparagine synthase (glutamine-hydrolysing)
MFNGLATKLGTIGGGRNRKALLALLTEGDRDLIARIRARNLTYLSDAKLASIAATCRKIEDDRLPGLFLEAGCALGGSAILIESVKNPARPLRIYDVFDMIPAPSQEDPPEVHDRYRTISEGTSPGIGGETYYGYRDNLYDLVCVNFEKFGIDLAARSVSLVKGLVQDTLKVDQPVAFAHIDVDWYAPVFTSLVRIFPHLSVGGSIILDDYYDWGGCRKATDRYLAEINGLVETDDTAGSLKITRIRD